MNTPVNQKENSKDAARSVTSRLHPLVYAALIGLALWFVLWIWSFAGAGIILHTGIGLRWPFTPKTTHDP